MSSGKVVAPKYKAMAYEDRASVIDAFNELKKINPNKKKVKFLIDLFNELHNNTLLTWRSYASCGDCQRALKSFFKYAIDSWT